MNTKELTFKNKNLNKEQKEELMTWYEKDAKWTRVINGVKRSMKQGGAPMNDKQKKDFDKTVETLVEVIEAEMNVKDEILKKARYWKKWQGGGYITLKHVAGHSIFYEDGIIACADWVVESHQNYLTEMSDLKVKYTEPSAETIREHFLATVVANIIYPLKKEADDYCRYEKAEFFQRVADYEEAQIEF